MLLKHFSYSVGRICLCFLNFPVEEKVTVLNLRRQNTADLKIYVTLSCCRAGKDKLILELGVDKHKENLQAVTNFFSFQFGIFIFKILETHRNVCRHSQITAPPVLQMKKTSGGNHRGIVGREMFGRKINRHI